MTDKRLSRRNLLKLAGVLSAAAVYDRRGIILPRMTAAALKPSEWQFTQEFPRQGTFETPVLSNDARFTSVEVSWLSNFATGEGLHFEARVSDDGVNWSPWSHLHPDGHALDDTAVRGHAFPWLAPGRYVQVRAAIQEHAGLQEITVTVRDTASDEFRTLNVLDSELIDGLVIPRSAWGADERLRHTDQDITKPLVWAPSHAPTEKIVIHHTDTTTEFDDPAALVRAVYYYHAISLGWGDVGYNYMIDWLGNVYEGRFGGPGVIGGHALRFNRGSIGIAFLGSFMQAGPGPAEIDALKRLIQLRASHIDVTKASTFAFLEGVPNLAGHGDLMATSCPGDSLYRQLPEIRGAIAGTGPVFIPRPVQSESIELLDFSVSPSIVEPDGLVAVKIIVRNPGSTTLETQGPDPGFIYRESQNYESAGFEKVTNRYRWGVEFAGAGPVVNPYRWGLGSPLRPGEERELVGHIRLEAFGERIATVAVLKEFVAYYVQRQFPRQIQTVHPLTQPTPPLNEPGVRFFDVTAHNVPEPFGTYWETRGGLVRFGYPLTEAFNERSIIDGNTYLTQYFERARFEYHPEYAGTEYEVLLGLLGVERTQHRLAEGPFQPVTSPSTAAGGFHFPETGHTLHGNFLRFWEENGGLSIFGYPISERFEEVSETDGELHVVQYFERNRFEYHPNLPELPHGVLLGHLAREILLDRGWLPRPLLNIPQG
jgi:hypothetical protein